MHWDKDRAKVQGQKRVLEELRASIKGVLKEIAEKDGISIEDAARRTRIVFSPTRSPLY